MNKFLYPALTATALLFLSGCSDSDDNFENIPSEDESLPGVVVSQEESDSPYYKLFVLNEGKSGTNNATLDFLRFSDGTYCRNTFSAMNPQITLGLGDVGNDIKVYRNTVWIAVNNSGLIEVIKALNEKHIATITVPNCRNIAFHDGKAYVSSYAGAVYGGNDIKGSVYMIDIASMSVTNKIEVGYQPEGLAVNNGKLYVANGGGFHSGYDNTVSVIDLSERKVVKTIEVAKNLKELFADDKGNIWLSALGDYYSVHSGIYRVNGSTDKVISNSEPLSKVRVSAMTMDDDGTVYAIGSDDEWNWSGTKAYSFYTISSSGAVKTEAFSKDMEAVQTPYSICVNSSNGDIYIGDAGDYLNPGTIWCFRKDLSLKWQTEGGVDPGHFALYSLYK